MHWVWKLWMCALVASSAFANPRLSRGLELIGEVNYPAALTELQAAKQVKGNSRETVLKILAAQGVATASMSQPDKARAYFLQLLVLDPNYALPPDYSPKVMTPFYEARAKAMNKGRLKITVTKTADALLANLEDPLNLANEVRFHVRRPGKGWTQLDAPVNDNQARVKVAPGPFEWRAEVLGDADAVLASEVEAPPVVDPKPKVDLTPKPRSPSPLDSRSEPPSRAASYVTWGAGAASAVAGGVFLYLGSHAKSEKERADVEHAEIGKIQSITQNQYETYAKQAQTFPVVGYALIGTAVALAATGTVVFFVSPRSQLVVAPNGVALSGTFD